MKLEEVYQFFNDNGYPAITKYISLHDNALIEIRDYNMSIQTRVKPFVYGRLIGGIPLKNIKHLKVNFGKLYIKVENDMGTVLIEVKA